jgi:hypothetical protein
MVLQTIAAIARRAWPVTQHKEPQGDRNSGSHFGKVRQWNVGFGKTTRVEYRKRYGLM